MLFCGMALLCLKLINFLKFITMKSLLFTAFLFCITNFAFAQFTPNTSSLYTTIKRYGHLRVDRDGYGFILGGSDTDRSDWYGQWYGLSRGSGNEISFSEGGNDDPVLLHGFFGLGFRTSNGKMALLRNGILAVGDLSKAEYDELRILSPSNTYKMYVQGGIIAERVKVQLKGDWADYVFEDDYQLPALEEVEMAIQKEGKLPDFPSAATVKAEGLEVGDITTLQQEKIEEVFLYLIDLQKEVKACHKEIASLKAQLNK